MAKYIAKEKLPQFLYYNTCIDENNGWTLSEDVNVHTDRLNEKELTNWKNAEYKIEGKRLTIEYARNELDINIYQKLYNESEGIKKGTREETEFFNKFREMYKTRYSEVNKCLYIALVLIKAMIKDPYIQETWIDRLSDLKEKMEDDSESNMTDLRLWLHYVDEVLSFGMLLECAQGFPLSYSNGDKTYPKMLLVEAELYQKYKNGENVKPDFGFIKESLEWNTCIMTINGEAAEKKMIFVMVPSDTSITISMLDERNGISEFYFYPKNVKGNKNIIKEYNDNNPDAVVTDEDVIVCNVWRCHPRGDWFCNGNGKDNYCYHCNGRTNCRHRSMNIIAAILMCYEQYQKKLLSAKMKADEPVTGPVRTENKTERKLPETYMPDGMIRIYDIPVTDSKFSRKNKFALYNDEDTMRQSSGKIPHVRKGTMRYNPKTGKRDIPVKGSIIHKDRYQGFSAADRVKN